MSETFDPDAWPQSSGGGKQPPGGDPPRKDNDDFDSFDNDDDYDPLAFEPAPSSSLPDRRDDDFGFPPPPPGAGQGDSFGYDGFDDDDDDLSTTGQRGGRQPQPAPDEFAPPGGSTDFDNLYDDDDYGSPPPPRSGGRSQYDDYDDYDEDDEFDREPRQSGGVSKLLPIIAAVVVVGAIGFAGMQLLGGDDKKKDDENATEQPSDTANGTGVSQEAPQEVIDAVDNALEAWGKFAVDGNLDHVKPYFVNDGPQFDQFLVDTEAISDKPPGGDPLVFSMQNPQTLFVKENDWLVKGDVIGTRPKEKAQNFSWEIRVVRQNDKEPWRIISIRQIT